MLLTVSVLLLAVVVVAAKDVNRTHQGMPAVREIDMQLKLFFLGSMLVDEGRKVMFCPIEKIASTQFRQLFYRLDNDRNWFEPPYHKKESPRLGSFSRERVQHMLTSPDWTRAILVRDPVKRLLSSFVHLVLNPHTPDRYRAALSKRHRNITWPDFVDAVTERDGYNNIHWSPQSRFCGLHRFHPYFNFVGNFEQLQAHGEMLNERAGLEAATSSGWGRCAYVKSPLGAMSVERRYKLYDVLLRNYTASNQTDDCMWCKNLAPHKSNYKKHPVSEMLSQAVWQQVRHSALYAPDYDMFEQLRQRGGVGPFNSAQYDNRRLANE